jgi:hypothetical protein
VPQSSRISMSPVQSSRLSEIIHSARLIVTLSVGFSDKRSEAFS